MWSRHFMFGSVCKHFFTQVWSDGLVGEFFSWFRHFSPVRYGVMGWDISAFLCKALCKLSLSKSLSLYLMTTCIVCHDLSWINVFVVIVIVITIFIAIVHWNEHWTGEYARVAYHTVCPLPLRFQIPNRSKQNICNGKPYLESKIVSSKWDPEYLHHQMTGSSYINTCIRRNIYLWEFRKLFAVGDYRDTTNLMLKINTQTWWSRPVFGWKYSWRDR